MKKLGLLLIVLFAGVVFAQESVDPMPTVDDLDAGAWNIIAVEGAVCARGTDYQFYVHPAASAKLMVYFQGGGACWNALSCREGGTFDDSVTDEELDGYDGIFNYENTDNPLADYNVVFIPYCTADIHTGDKSEVYNSIEIDHNGYNNAAAVLDWVYANFDAPETVFIAGSSAGAYGAIYHAPFIIEHYSDADIAVFGDAGVGITPMGWSVLADNWDIYANMPDFVPGLMDADPTTFTANVLYESNAIYSPDVRFAEFTTYADEVQSMFYIFSAPGASEQDWIDGAQIALDALDEYANFSSYVAPGIEHTILAYPQFYTMEVAGVSIRDWVAALVNGEQPDSVHCVECE